MLLPLLLSAAGFSACRVRIVFSFDYVLAKQRPEITNRVDVLIDIGNVEIRNVQLAVRGGTLSRFDIIAYRPAAQRIEVLVAGYIAVCAAHHEADQQLGSIRMLALADNVQGVDCRDTSGRLKVYRSEAPVVIFVILNGEVTPADQKAEIMKKELQWCKSVLDASDKKWRIVMTHAGPYTSNHDPLDVRDYYINDSEYSLDAMGVDLFLNGHDHIYIRSTVKNDIKVNTGDGTTYLTGGTVGNKFYEYIPARSDYSTDFYTDEEDKQVFSIIEFNEDSIKGEMHFRGKTGKNIEEKTDKKGKNFLQFSAFSAEKVNDGFEYLWVRFLGFDREREEWLQPQTGIEAKGELELSVYNDKLNIACKVSEMSEYVKQPYNPNN